MDVYKEALNWFRELLDAANKAGLREPMAMSLATASTDGQPAVRTMLLKGVDERGFVFITSRNSRKGQELQENPRASMCFYWQTLIKQVRVDGLVELVGDDEADHYWRTRPRDSQLAAWASDQSEPFDDRKLLERRLEESHERFMDQAVPRPPHWAGYRLVPERIEFWKSGWHRLHERVCYEKTPEGWQKSLLYP